MTPLLQRTLRRLSPVRPWFEDVSRDSLRDDALAGLTNAAIVLPQGVAFAIIAGLPPEYGLFTAIVVCAVAALWGASMVMVSGPTTAISAVVFATLSQFALAGTEQFVALALVMTLMVGFLQLMARPGRSRRADRLRIALGHHRIYRGGGIAHRNLTIARRARDRHRRRRGRV
ncbi:SulP family inorganic anion transporter [Phaeobacter sp. J2-8]|uniref:SulP family inorganic anion transporter n=1 Tax=Phaeobacter sp. J2-8 TaxID=2931394 RepID=UPI002457AB8B|nr:SulP family inorganic anion transporter [Phaeobacter sp. J2-8]